MSAINKTRRDFITLIAGGIAAIPVLNLVGTLRAEAQELPHVDEANDPTAKALQYVHDATKAARVDKAGTPAANQNCANCQLIQSDSGDWRPCALFPGKAVNANGWCLSWTPKSS